MREREGEGEKEKERELRARLVLGGGWLVGWMIAFLMLRTSIGTCHLAALAAAAAAAQDVTE